MKSVSTEKAEVIVLPADKLEYLQKELLDIREDLHDNKYIKEARLVLTAGGLRSAIGCYWNAVVDDLRKKVMHRSLDLFNREMNAKVKSYEDFQVQVVDHDLIEGAYKIGVLSWEAKKVMHQSRETRNIFDGHPDSSDPSLFKVLNMFSDCNRYVLSQDYPIPIINVNEYLVKMDTDAFKRNELVIEQAFIDLPEVYKQDMANKLFTYYLSDSISTRFRGNIEFSYPILWRVLPKGIRQIIGQRFDKVYLENDADKNDKGVELLASFDGLRYLSTTTRKLIYEPRLAHLEDNLDVWSEEGDAVRDLARYGTVIPESLISRFVTAITLTYVGRVGSSSYAARTAFFSDKAAPIITKMVERFDNRSAEEFVNTIKTNELLQGRIKGSVQLNRLRALGDIILNKPEIKGATKEFLEFLVDRERTKDFLYNIDKKKF